MSTADYKFSKTLNVLEAEQFLKEVLNDTRMVYDILPKRGSQRVG